MRYEDASLSGNFQDVSGPDARSDSDALAAGSRGPATGNTITGAGTSSGAAGADIAAGARIVAIEGAGGSDTSFANGQLRVEGEHGTLLVRADGNYSYTANANTPENSRDIFTYTLADSAGAQDRAQLVIEIGKTQAAIAENAQRIVPGPDGVVILPAGVDLSDVRVVGRDLVIMLPDGTQMVIVDGAVFVPQLVINDVEVPATNLAALLVEQEPLPASGIPQSSGGNFGVPVGPLDPGVPLGDLLPPTELDYTPPEFNDVADLDDREPEAGAVALAFDDDDVPGKGGIAGGTGDDLAGGSANVLSGQLPGSGGDGDLDFELLTDFEPAGFDYVDGPNGSILVQQNGVTVLTVALNEETGEYSVTQNNPIRHPAGGDENNVEFVIGYRVVDSDGDAALGTITINVDDDTPTATVTATNEASVTLTTFDAATPGEGFSTAVTNANFSSVFSGSTAAGADGAASSSSVFALNVATQGGDSGLKSANQTIYLYKLADGSVVGSTANTAPASATAASVVFSVTVTNGGVVTLTQLQQIDHLNTDPTPGGPDYDDHMISLTDTLITLSRTDSITDNDQDTASDTEVVNIGANLQFRDDGPTLGTVLAGSGVELDETSAVTPAGFPLSATSAAPVIVAVGSSFGADGAGANGGVDYGLQIVGGGATALQTAIGNHAITLVQVDANTVDGRYNDGSEKTAFTVDIAADGKITVTMNVPLEHLTDGDTPADYNDALDLAGLLNATVTVRDFDGDSVSGSAPIGDRIVFLDDGPNAGTPGDAPVLVLDETRPLGSDQGGDSDPAGLKLATVNFAQLFGAAAHGADGPGTVAYALNLNLGVEQTSIGSGLYALDPSDTLEDGDGIGQGAEILLIQSGNVITGAIGEDVYFTITINPVTGILTFEQNANIWHASTASGDEGQFISLPAGTITVDQIVTDSDGDFDTATIDLSDDAFGIEDSAPVATVNANAALDTIVLDETRNVGTDTPGANPPMGDDQATANFADNFSGPANFGSDGPGDVTYDLVLNLAVGQQSAASGLYALDPSDTSATPGDGYGQGAEIQLVNDNGVIRGVANNQTYFTIVIDADTGVVTFTQLQEIWHPTAGSSGAALDDAAALSTAVASVLQVRQTITDADGDSSSATVNVGQGVFSIQDDGPVASAEGVQTVGEGLSVSGQFDFDMGEDGGGITAINGTPLVFTNGDSQPIVLANGTLVVTSTGGYTFTANNPGSGTVAGTFTVTDGDGDTATQPFSFIVVDLNTPTAGTSAARLDDDGLAPVVDAVDNGEAGDIDANFGEVDPENAEEDVFHGDLNFSFGGDGPGAISFAPMNGQPGVVGTENVVYSWNALTLTLTATTVGGSRPGTELFTLVLDDATSGEYTLTLKDNVLHAAGGNNEANAPNVALTFAVTDFDGSSANPQGTLNIAFNDDVPTLSIGTNGATEPVLTTRDAFTDGDPTGEDTALATTGNFGGVFTFAVDAGADGVGSESKVFDFDVLVADSGLTSHNQAIYLYDKGNGLVIASTSNVEPANASAPGVVFTVQVDPSTGVVTLTQYQQVDHAVEANTGSPFDDQYSILTDGKLVLKATATVTDGDGDQVSDTKQVDLGGNLRFADDGPTLSNVGTAPQMVIDETAARPGTGTFPISVSSAGPVITATEAFGADGAAAGNAAKVYGLAVPGDATSVLTDLVTAVGDFPITIVETNATTLTGQYQNGGTQTAFTIIINPVTGQMTYQQFVPLEHNTDGNTIVADNDTNTPLDLDGYVAATLTITDFDGDTASAGVGVGGLIRIFDDGPLAQNDVDAIAQGSNGPATGNVLTGVEIAVAEDGNASDGLADNVGADGGRVTFIDSNNNPAPGAAVPAGGSVQIAGQYGTLTIFANGDYSYARTPGLGGGQQEGFTYTVTDNDGDFETATLTISIANLAPTAGDVDVKLDDDALGGNLGGPNDDVDAENASGLLPGAGGDGALTWSFTALGTQPALPTGFTYGTVDADTIQVLQNGTLVLTLQITNPATGAYTVTQEAPIQHASEQPGVLNNENNLDLNGFKYVVRDQDNDSSAPGTIDINIDDDTPTVTTTQLTGTVDEDGVTEGPADGGRGDGVAGGTDDVAGTAVSATGNVGALFNAGADTPLTYQLLGNFAGLEAQSLTSGGAPLSYAVVFNAGTYTLTATAAGQTVFTFTLNATTGAYNFTLVDQLDHPTLNGQAGDDTENNLAIQLGSLIQATDRDGDSITALSGQGQGLLITVDDDSPVVNSVTSPLQIENDATPSATGSFDFDIGADENADFDDISVSNFQVRVNGVLVPALDVTFSQAGAETAGTASYDFSFKYDTGTGGLATATGTLVFDKAAGTYTVELTSGPLEGFGTFETADGTAFQGYQLNSTTLDNTQPTVAVTTIQEESAPNANDGFYVQFTGISSGNGNHETIGDGTATTFTNGDLFSEGTGADALYNSWVSVSGSSNGVAGDTIQGPDVLNFNLYSSNPEGTLGLASKAVDSLYMSFDGIGAAEDMIVVLKLWQDANDNGQIDAGDTFTTKAVMVTNADIYKFDAANYASTQAALDGSIYEAVEQGIKAGNGSNNDGLVIIESNDYNGTGENWQIIGAQVVDSETNVSGTAINLNRAVGLAGDSDADNLGGLDTQPFSTDGNDNPLKITNIGFVASTSTDQNAELSFDVTIEDHDGDKIVTPITVEIGDVAGATSLASFAAMSVEEETLDAEMRVANTNTTLFTAAVAAAGLAAMPAAAEEGDSFSEVSSLMATDDSASFAIASKLAVETEESVTLEAADQAGKGAEVKAAATNLADSASEGGKGVSDIANDGDAGSKPSELLGGTDMPGENAPAPAAEIAMPSLDGLAGLLEAAQQGGAEKQAAVIEKVVAEALEGGEAGISIDALLNALPGGESLANAPASPAANDVPGWDSAHSAALSAPAVFSMEAVALHHDAVQAA